MPSRPLGTKASAAQKHRKSSQWDGNSPLRLVQGVYNPPQSMSKRTAKRWAAVAPMKNRSVEKRDIKDMVQEKSIKIQAKDHGKTMAQVVSSYFHLDPPTARLKIVAGEVWLKNSMHARYSDNSPSQTVVFGDELAGFIRKPRSAAIETKAEELITDLKSSILYKDSDIIVINKQSEVSVHGGSKSKAFNLDLFLDQLGGNAEKPRLCHRLDKGTTGCLILARSKEAAARVARLFQDPAAVSKRYLAVLVPPLSKMEFPERKTFTITSGLVQHGEFRGQKMKAVPWNDSFGSDPSFQDIQKAVTDVTILKNRTLASLVCLKPQTGRKHQLRVHMASLSSFILGDFKYGIGCTKQFAHQVSDPLKIPLHLHLRQITLKNWFGDGKDLSVSAPLPGFWQKTLLSSGHDPNDADIPLQASLNK
ncbi:hypothetical protein HDV03_000845 [Kappamyces sp. JEL0829]|nr:hypothetical protein HDV03_000845 [Kappamyces sp. JEL0829]